MSGHEISVSLFVWGFVLLFVFMGFTGYQLEFGGLLLGGWVGLGTRLDQNPDLPKNLGALVQMDMTYLSKVYDCFPGVCFVKNTLSVVVRNLHEII
jgi:hypothetical protein